MCIYCAFVCRINIYKIVCPTSVKRIEAVEIDVTNEVGWFLKKLLVRSTRSGDVFTAECNLWLGDQEPEMAAEYRLALGTSRRSRQPRR